MVFADVVGVFRKEFVLGVVLGPELHRLISQRHELETWDQTKLSLLFTNFPPNLRTRVYDLSSDVSYRLDS